MIKKIASLVFPILVLVACNGSTGPSIEATEQAATAEAAIDATRIGQLTQQPASPAAPAASAPAETPGPTPESRGDQIAFWRDQDGAVDIIVIDPDTRRERNLTLYPRPHAFRPAWSPDSRYIAFVADDEENWDIYFTPADGSVFLPKALTIWMGPDLYPQWSPDGKYIAYYTFLDGQFDIFRIDVDTHVKANLTIGTPESSESFPEWSPDGTQILFVSDRDRNDELYMMTADGWDVTRLTETPDAKEWNAAWSPDGARIAFVSDRDGNDEIYLTKPDGTDLRQITQNEGDDGIPTWSPDGGRMLFASRRDGNTEIYMLDLACVETAVGCEGQAINLTDNPADDSLPSWSPDGTRIAFVSTRDGHENIFAMQADGSDPVNLTENLGQEWGPVWAPRPDRD